MQRQAVFALITMLFFSTCSMAFAVDSWPEFRGPTGQGVAPGSEPAVSWSETEHVTWKVPVVGEGHSSPVIADGQVWLTTAVVTPLSKEEEEARLQTLKNARGINWAGKLSLRALCFDFSTGELLKEIELFQVDDPEPKHSMNSYASPTPVISEGRVYLHFGSYGTACVDAKSHQVVWKMDELKVDHQNGPGSSPVVWEDLLIVHYDGIDQQFLVAYNQDDGTVVWRTERSGEMNPKAEFQKAYCTPVVVSREDGRPLLLSPAADWVYAYDPRTGEEIWRADYGQLGFSTVPRPTVASGVAYVCTSFIRSRLVAVTFEGEGDVTKTNVKWTSDSQVPQKPSLVFANGRLYFVNDSGILTCLDAETGEQVYRQRLGGNFAASPILANGLIYFSGMDGKTTVIKPSDEFELVAENQLDAGFMASPAVVGDALVLRTETHLYRIEE